MPHRPETSATPAAVAIPDSIDSLQPPLGLAATAGGHFQRRAGGLRGGHLRFFGKPGAVRGGRGTLSRLPRCIQFPERPLYLYIDDLNAPASPWRLSTSPLQPAGFRPRVRRPTRPLSEAVASASAVLLVLNKVDLLPCDAKKSELKLVQWVREQPEYARLPNTLSVHLVSATSGWGLPRLLRKIHDYCRGNEVSASVVGLTNVGKSSMINRMLGGKVRVSARTPTTARFPRSPLPARCPIVPRFAAAKPSCACLF